MSAAAVEAVRSALREAGVSDVLTGTRDLSGGCIHRVIELCLADGTTLIAKINKESMLPAFQNESHDLAALHRTATVVVPSPLAAIATQGHAVLLMTRVEKVRATNATWENFGHDLAALHAAPAGDRYGWDVENQIGSTPQPNSWHNDWVEFNAVNRIGFQLSMAREHGRLDAKGVRSIEQVIVEMDQFIPRRPRPSLLHGDLWSGNAVACQIKGRPTFALIDPACSIGDALADIAMMQLFGGFTSACLGAYERASGLRLDAGESRDAIAVYQLYHALNHLNIFGAGYAPQAVGLARSLGA